MRRIRTPQRRLLLLFAFLLIPSVTPAAPDWAADAVWYQIFPERFRNGDSSNDPTRDSLNHPRKVPGNWRVHPWTDNWYDRLDWERRMGPDFYHPLFERRYGGDLQGVIDRLDYLADLGVNAIYFNPVFYANSLHKYDGNVFHHIDPFLGPDPEGDLARIAGETDSPFTWEWTAADKLFLELIAEAKKRGIRIILDGVWNHTGTNCFAFRDVVANQAKSRYRDWYKIESFDDPRTMRNEFAYRGWHGFSSLPEFADAPGGDDLARGPKRYIFAATERWMDPDGDGDPSDGIDGWRLDVAEEVPDGFWREWNALVKEINPEAYTTAEIWGPSADYLRRTGFDAAMNYAGFAIPVKGWLVDGQVGAAEFADRMEARINEQGFPRALALQNLVDSHDTQRIASAIANRPGPGHSYHAPRWFDYDQWQAISPRASPDYDIRAPGPEGRRIWKMVALLQSTWPGAPMIYYGTESGMWGGDDPDDRMPMVWPDLDYEPIRNDPRGGPVDPAEPVAFDEDMHAFYRAVLAFRDEEEALRRGGYERLATGPDWLAFERETHGRRLVVVFNRGSKPLETGRFLAPGETVLFATDPGSTKADQLPALSAAVFGTP